MQLTTRFDTVPPADEEINLSTCVGLYPKPGCGTEPQASGDRGGAAQIAVFGVLVAALCVIGVRIARAIVARDRAMDPTRSTNE
jgi:hypothetical protein